MTVTMARWYSRHDHTVIVIYNYNYVLSLELVIYLL